MVWRQKRQEKKKGRNSKLQRLRGKLWYVYKTEPKLLSSKADLCCKWKERKEEENMTR